MKNFKKTYTQPISEFVTFSVADVITLSKVTGDIDQFDFNGSDWVAPTL